MVTRRSASLDNHLQCNHVVVQPIHLEVLESPENRVRLFKEMFNQEFFPGIPTKGVPAAANGGGWPRLGGAQGLGLLGVRQTVGRIQRQHQVPPMYEQPMHSSCA